MNKNILVFGGTGFVGKAITKKLIEYNYKPVLFIRESSTNKIPSEIKNKIEVIIGNIEKIEDYEDKIKSYEIYAIIYLIGLIREFPQKNIKFIDYHYNWLKKVIDLAIKLNINRFILMSANGVKENGTTYQRTKFMGEEYLRKTNLNWTIFRPSLIIDDDKEAFNFKKLILDLSKFIFFPIFSNGKYKVSPVHREDVSEIFVRSIENEKTFKRIFHICGKNSYNYVDFVKLVAKSNKKFIIPVYIPSFIIIPIAKIFRYVEFFPASDEQIKMLLEGNTCVENDIWDILNLKPRDVF
ncbi:MAG: NAD(P)H-binding protein [candidate division WOR-3 bacterium]|jgi:NADH dehydrogenase